MIWLSASSMKAFMECPQSLYYNQHYKITREREFNFGTRVHELMELGQEPLPEDQASVKMLHPKLRTLIQNAGFVAFDGPAGHEVKQVFEVVPGVMFTRIIDSIGTMGDNIVAVDYKTTMATGPTNWAAFQTETGDYIAPQAVTYQAVSYLIPNFTGITFPDKFKKKWPKSIYFFVVPMKGGCKIFEYKQKEEDLQNFYNVVLHIKDLYESGSTYINVRNPGKGCFWCNWRDICYKTPGWQEFVVERDRNAEMTEIFDEESDV